MTSDYFIDEFTRLRFDPCSEKQYKDALLALCELVRTEFSLKLSTDMNQAEYSMRNGPTKPD